MKITHVVIGILRNAKKEVLIALRPAHVVQPGVWEFPGGKVEDGETYESALVREYQEEIGILIKQSEFQFSIEKVDSGKKLFLHIFEILEYQDEPQGMEGQEIRFVPIDTLKNYTFPKANQKIIAWLCCKNPVEM